MDATKPKPETKKARAAREKQEAREYLRTILPPGSRVWTILRYVGRSGMTRHISLVVRDGDDIRDISGPAAVALDYRRHDDGGLIVGGCGMDMGYHLVNSLSYALHGHATVGPEATRAEGRGVPCAPTPANYRAGYSLRHSWL